MQTPARSPGRASPRETLTKPSGGKTPRTRTVPSGWASLSPGMPHLLHVLHTAAMQRSAVPAHRLRHADVRRGVRTGRRRHAGGRLGGRGHPACANRPAARAAPPTSGPVCSGAAVDAYVAGATDAWCAWCTLSLSLRVRRWRTRAEAVATCARTPRTCEGDDVSSKGRVRSTHNGCCSCRARQHDRRDPPVRHPGVLGSGSPRSALRFGLG